MAREIKVSTCFSKLPHAVKTVQGNEKANFRLHDLIINDAPLDVSTSNWFFTRNIFPIVFSLAKKKITATLIFSQTSCPATLVNWNTTCRVFLIFLKLNQPEFLFKTFNLGPCKLKKSVKRNRC